MLIIKQYKLKINLVALKLFLHMVALRKAKLIAKPTKWVGFFNILLINDFSGGDFVN